jgi:hypothetical protein
MRDHAPHMDKPGLLTNNMGTKQEDKILGTPGIVVGIHY